MKKATLEEIKLIQLDILKNARDFCAENNINYFLDNGTLLGAVRHKGYIPWDDDIDIGMLRKDFDKFIKLFNEKMANTKYRCYCVSNNKSFYYPFAKICDISTCLYEPDEDGFKGYINIDLFPYDNASNNSKENERLFKKRDRLTALNYLRNFHTYNSGRFIFLKRIIYCLILLFPKDYFSKKLVKCMQKFNKCNSNLVGNFSSFSKVVANKEIFNSYIDVEFENNTFKAPAGYDKWLKAFYGDYMQLPPIEKRVSHHSFVCYIPGNGEIENE